MGTIYRGSITPEELRDLIYRDQAAKGMRLLEGSKLTHDLGINATEFAHDIWFEVEIMPKEQTESWGNDSSTSVTGENDTQTTSATTTKPRKEKVPFDKLPEKTQRRIKAMNEGRTAAKKRQQQAELEQEPEPTGGDVGDTQQEETTQPGEVSEQLETSEVVAATEIPFQH